MQQETRKSYEAPKIEKLGSLQEITLQGGLPNNDTPGGPGNTAFS